MQKRWAVQVGMSVICAAVAAGCARSDERGQAETPAQATVSLSGCVEAAPGTNRYTLRNVRFEPRLTGDPHAGTTTPGPHGITEGAWVRLDGGDQDLRSVLGQRVTLTGVIADSGRNTVGTSGTPGHATPSGDTSQAASTDHHADKVKTEAGRIARESIADGTAAQVRVQQVKASGEKCF